MKGLISNSICGVVGVICYIFSRRVVMSLSKQPRFTCRCERDLCQDKWKSLIVNMESTLKLNQNLRTQGFVFYEAKWRLNSLSQPNSRKAWGFILWSKVAIKTHYHNLIRERYVVRYHDDLVKFCILRTYLNNYRIPRGFFQFRFNINWLWFGIEHNVPL